MRELLYRDAIREAIIEEMERDEKVFLIGEDIGIYGGAFRAYNGLLEKFGAARVIDTPISENAIVGASIGAALVGYRPVAEIMFIDFTALAMDQIVNQAAKLKYMTGDSLSVPIVIRTQGGAGRGVAAQHSQSLEAWFYHVPGLKVVMPATSYDVKGLLKTSIRDNEPVLFIEHKMIYQFSCPVPEKEYLIPLGVADIKKEGKDITLVAYSNMLFKALEAANELEKDGINCEVIDPRTLVPLDINTIFNSVKKTGHLVVITEACERGSVASDISSKVGDIMFDYLDAPVKIVACPNSPIPYNSRMEQAMIPDKDMILKVVKEIL